MTERTPTEYRVILDAWRKTAPANDSDILPPERYSDSPRHSALAHQLNVLMQWRTHRESNEPLQTNYMQPENDNQSAIEPGEIGPPKRDIECELEIRPTPNEIMTALKDVILCERDDGKVIPTGGDIEYEKNSENPPRWRPYVRLGELQFSVTEGSELYPRYSLTRWREKRPIERRGTPKGSTKSKRLPARSIFEQTNQHDAMASAQEAKFLDANLAPDDIAVLDASLWSESFKAVGEALGYSGKTAERQGKRRLLAAAKNLTVFLEKLAA